MFSTNLLLPHSSGVAEPSIRSDSAGRSFVIGPTGVPAGCKAWRITHDGSSATYLGYPDGTVGGGDCDWAVGPAETGSTNDNLAYSSLSLANITTGHSNDGGTTFGVPNAFSQQVAGDDRMWMAADPQLNSLGHDTVYMSYHDVTAGEIEVGVSLDGGETYVQNSPLINPLDVPLDQWTSAPGFDGNELGNLVARRDSTGALTLYSIFETPDSAVDSASQNLAQTANFNRVYEAVGTVTNAGAVPVITWHDYEIWHGPAGAQYNRIFPATAVDSAGRVYAVFADGNHVYFKSDSDGTHWDPSVAPQALPSSGNTAIMPWIVAGGAGLVDVVWYGASGGSGMQPHPEDSAGNQWVVDLAQSLDGGATWTTAQASDHVIHTGSICIQGLNCDLVTGGDRTLLDFFQVALDPSNGAATIAYADDHASPGTAVVYYTRQCTGDSATTGLALTNDCVAPAAPAAAPQGSTCPGPQVVDSTGDAPNNYPGGDGSNMGSLDIVNASFAPADATDLKITLTLQDLEGLPPNLPAAFWRVSWKYGGMSYDVQADTNSGLVTTYELVATDSSGNSTATSVMGSYNTGPNGTITWTVPLADIGNPPAGASLTGTFAEDHGAIEVAGNGLYYTAPADRAPDGGSGADALAGGCPTAPAGGGGGSSSSGGGGGSSPSGGGGGGGGSSPSGGGGGGSSPSGGGGGGGGGALPPVPPGQALPPQGAPPSGVAGTQATLHRFLRGHGVVRAAGRVGRARFSIDLSRGPAGKVVYVDLGRGIAFHTLSIASIHWGAESAQLAGFGLLNGKRVAFSAVAIDNGSTHDVFRIAWGGGASRGGVLLGGSVVIR